MLRTPFPSVTHLLGAQHDVLATSFSVLPRRAGAPTLGCAAISSTPAKPVATASVADWGDEATPDDLTLNKRIQAALLRVPSLRHADIAIESSRGVVRMSGMAVSSVDRLTAVEVVRKVAGVLSVRNEMSFHD